MAASGLLALLDDIASVLDDVAVLSKIAAKKTSGVLGDDLALNAEQVSGVRAERELPVVWAVAKGSMLNKCLLVPAALLISAFIPWAIVPLLMLGGAFLCYEGAEKIIHKLFHKEEEAANKQAIRDALITPDADLIALEQEKIKGAIRTDFILSAEIIVIILGTIQESPFMTQVIVLSLLAFAFTVGVYGLVAAIVKLDDAGLWLTQTGGRIREAIGRGLLVFTPFLMKTLSVVGTIAMFLVGGGILLHGIPGAEHAVAEFAKGNGPVIGLLIPSLSGGLLGVIAGLILLGAHSLLPAKKP